jgi:hypothetical protein
MRKTAIALITIPSFLFTGASWGAGMMKQGLWEVTTKSDAMKNMPKISPEQMEKMRQMGIQVPQMSDGGMVTKMCVSKAMSEREQPLTGAPGESGGKQGMYQSGCEHKNFQRTGNSFSVDIVCDGPHMKGTGSAKGSFSGDSFTSTYDFQGTSDSKAVIHHMESSAKYLGADCGGVRPLDEFMKK